MAVFVARQPIFDQNMNLFGYELLFRSGLENYCNNPDGDASTLEVIANSFLVIGLDELTDGKRGFINFTKNLVVQGVPTLLPQDQIVVELLEDTEPTPDVIEACRKLREAGYMLAVDDFVLNHRGSELVELADIIKVDFVATRPEQREEIARQLAGKDVSLLAEKVESDDDYQQALESGYAYFQGYFFSRPSVRVGAEISSNRLSQIRIMHEINQTDTSLERFEEVIKQDVALTYKLLRFMNSAWFGFRTEIRSIRHALVLLGPREFRKWVSLVLLRNLSDEKPPELVLRSITRAKIAEGLAPMIGMDEKGPELFLLGMFSFIDALTDMPLKVILPRLPLSHDLTSALLGKPGKFRTILDVIESYEMGQWSRFENAAASLSLPESDMPDLFNNSWQWAKQAFAAA